MNRRDFIHQLSHAAAIPALMSGISWDSMAQMGESSLLGNTLSQGNILIVVLLNGGNDGLNTVIPLNMMSQLNKVRPKVIIPENKLLSLGKSDLALHPSLTGLQSLSKENRLKIIQSVGYPTPNYSHFRAMDIWQSGATASEFFSSGWIGRFLESKHPEFPQAYPNANYPHPLALEIGWNSALMFTGQHSFTSVVASNPENFYEIIGDLDVKYPSTPIGEKLSYLQLIAKQSNAYGKVMKDSYQNGKEFSFPNTNLANQFKIIARLISGGLNTRIYKVEIGGFDTHSNQVDSSDRTKGTHANLMTELNDAITTFMKSMDSINQSDRIVGMCFSEFGRTIQSNDTSGTDHGAIAPVILFGNQLDANVAGTNPVIPTNLRGQDELDLQFDFKQVYSSLISQWLGGGNAVKTLFSKEYPQISIIKDEFRDSDEDGVGDLYDKCPDTPFGTIVDITGCEVFMLPKDNFEISVASLTCQGTKNGSIQVKVKDKSYTYKIELREGTKAPQVLEISKGSAEVTIKNLGAEVYKLAITIPDKPSFQQNFELKISEPDVLKVNASIQEDSKLLQLAVSGATNYLVSINGIEKEYNAPLLNLPIESGLQDIRVKTNLACQGVFKTQLFLSETVNCFPNPTADWTNLYINGQADAIHIKVFGLNGQQLFEQRENIPNSRLVPVNLSELATGTYLLQLQNQEVQQTIKIIKI